MAGQVIYKGKVKKLGVPQEVRVLHNLTKNNSDSTYTVVFEDRSKHRIILNCETGNWEEKKLGVTRLSKKYGKIIEAWFD